MTTTYINPRKYLIVTSKDHVVEVRVKRNPATLARNFFDLDFRGAV